MTHTTVSTKRESHGSTTACFQTVDITSLDAAGAETSFDPDAETGVNVSNTGGIDVVGQENGQYRVFWDHVNDQLAVVAVADGTDVASGTDVGEVVLCVEGV